jgi:hypothetical protein
MEPQKLENEGKCLLVFVVFGLVAPDAEVRME